MRTQGNGNELEVRDESVTAGDHVLGDQSATGGQVNEEGNNETFSITSLLRYRLQFRLQVTHCLRIHEERRGGTEPQEKSVRMHIARVLVKEDQN